MGYSIVLEVEALIVKNLQPGKAFRDIYTAAQALVKQRAPALAAYFVKNVGWVMGLEFMDNRMTINEKSEHKVISGMVFCISIGFSDGPRDQNTWAVWITDTVLVPTSAVPGSSNAHVLTENCLKSSDDVMYELGDEPNA